MGFCWILNLFTLGEIYSTTLRVPEYYSRRVNKFLYSAKVHVISASSLLEVRSLMTKTMVDKNRFDRVGIFYFPDVTPYRYLYNMSDNYSHSEWNYKTRIACKKILLWKSIKFSILLKQSTTCYKQKKRNITCYQTTNLPIIWFLLLVCMKG